MITFKKCKCEVERGKFSVNNIPLDCPAVWQLIATGHTVGVFQLEKNLGQDWSKKVKPDCIEELAALTALLRPGPLECIGENVSIMRRRESRGKNKKGHSYYRSSIKQLRSDWMEFETCKYKGNRRLNIVSVDEKTGSLINNKINAVIPKGKGIVHSIRVRTSWTFPHKAKWLDIHATNNHFFLTSKGWRQLIDIKAGNYISVFSGKQGGHTRKDHASSNVPGQKNFRNIAFYHWEYHCVCCDWDEASLDVHHLDGNRTTNNDPDNLIWLCPNHHRMYTDGKLCKDKIIKMREQYRLPNPSDTRFVRVEEIRRIGEENLYDISVDGPNHNYIAGNFVVHNSGMTQDYVDIKFKRKENEYLHPALEPILEPTFGCLVYQEQAIRIATDLAGLSPESADELRKAIGKKKPELMAKVKKKFVEGAQSYGKISQEIAEEIFGWIEKCQRYSFNKSHAVSYGMIAYQTAWVKCHFPQEFFTSYLTYSQYKGDPKEEIYKLVQDSRLFGIDIFPPDIRRGNVHFQMVDNPSKGIAFGLAHIRGVGSSAIQKIVAAGKETPAMDSVETNVWKHMNSVTLAAKSALTDTVKEGCAKPVKYGLKTWADFLAAVPTFHRNVGIALIKAGACDCYHRPRSEMVRELEVVLGTTVRDHTGKKVDVRGLTDKEKNHFFAHLQEDIMDTRQILLEMSQPPGEKTKTIRQMTKRELVKTAVGYLDQADVAFDGITDGDSKFVYTSPSEKSDWLDNVKDRTKTAIEKLMLENGYQDIAVKPPCSSEARRTKMAQKANILEEELQDTSMANATAEKHFLGIALSCSRADDADNALATHTCLDIARAANNESIVVCVIIDSVKHTKTKRGSNPGQPMCFLTMSDATYSIDHAVVFPDAFHRLKAFCKDDLIGLVYGEKKNGSFIVKDIQKLM